MANSLLSEDGFVSTNCKLSSRFNHALFRISLESFEVQEQLNTVL